MNVPVFIDNEDKITGRFSFAPTATDPDRIFAEVQLGESGIDTDIASFLNEMPLDPGRKAVVQIYKDGLPDMVFSTDCHRYDLVYNINFASPIRFPGNQFCDTLLKALIKRIDAFGDGNTAGHIVSLNTAPEDEVILFDTDHEAMHEKFLKMHCNSLGLFIEGNTLQFRRSNNIQLINALETLDGFQFPVIGSLGYYGQDLMRLSDLNDSSIELRFQPTIKFPKEIVSMLSRYFSQNNIKCRARAYQVQSTL